MGICIFNYYLKLIFFVLKKDFEYKFRLVFDVLIGLGKRFYIKNVKERIKENDDEEED